MRLSKDLVRAVHAHLEPGMVALGFRKRAKGWFTRELAPDVLGVVLLADQTIPGQGLTEITPRMGVRYQDLERVRAELSGYKYHPYLPATSWQPLQHPLPYTDRPRWTFGTIKLIPPHASGLIEAVDQYSTPYFAERLTLESFINGMELSILGGSEEAAEKLAIALWLTGDKDAADYVLEGWLERFRGDVHTGANKFREFARGLRQKMWPERNVLSEALATPAAAQPVRPLWERRPGAFPVPFAAPPQPRPRRPQGLNYEFTRTITEALRKEFRGLGFNQFSGDLHVVVPINEEMLGNFALGWSLTSSMTFDVAGGLRHQPLERLVAELEGRPWKPGWGPTVSVDLAKAIVERGGVATWELQQPEQMEWAVKEIPKTLVQFGAPILRTMGTLQNVIERLESGDDQPPNTFVIHRLAAAYWLCGNGLKADSYIDEWWEATKEHEHAGAIAFRAFAVAFRQHMKDSRQRR